MIYTEQPWFAHARPGDHEPVVVRAEGLGIVAVLPRNEYSLDHALLIAGAVPLARELERTIEEISALEVLLSQGGIRAPQAADTLTRISERAAQSLRLVGWAV